MKLPQLSPVLRDAYLRRLGVTAPAVTLAGLTALQRAHLRRVPFHNLALLRNAGRPYDVPAIEAIAADNARGLGGTCHLTTPAFAALLQALGFDVALVAGTVSRPDDHLLARVRVEGGDYVVDVGNGHPYVHPFPLDRERAWEVYSWSFQWRGDALFRTFPDGQNRQVYRVNPTPRAWTSFEDSIRGHHEQPEFGPFFASLRAVRLDEHVIVAVRDATVTRYSALGTSTRPISSFAAARRVLVESIALPIDLVDDALSSLERARPKLFASAAMPSTPRFLVGITTIGREAQVQTLLDSLERDREASGVAPADLEVVVLDNHAPGAERATRARDRSFDITRVAITDVSLEIERQLGLLPDETPPVCTAAARHALVRVLATRLSSRAGPWIVWMLDDDLRLTQLVRTEQGLTERAELSLLDRLRRLWRERPDISIGLGRFCGDPPIPGFATWLGQLRDLEASLDAMATRRPEQPWLRSAHTRVEPNDYYDHADDKLNSGRARPFEATPGATVGEVFVQLAGAWGAVAHGAQVTRPLVHEGDHHERGESSARGGNVVCFDRDALIAAPFPGHQGRDGVISRRADTLAAMLAQGGVWTTREIDLPVMHRRLPEDGSSPMASSTCVERELAAFVESQARGVAMTRAIQRDAPEAVGELLARRRALHLDGFRATRGALERVRTRLHNPGAWWWNPTYEPHANALLGALTGLAQRIPSDVALEAACDVASELTDFVRSLRERAAAWRRSWG